MSPLALATRHALHLAFCGPYLIRTLPMASLRVVGLSCAQALRYYTRVAPYTLLDAERARAIAMRRLCANCAHAMRTVASVSVSVSVSVSSIFHAIVTGLLL